MKNIIKYGLLSLVAAASVSCESFLNERWSAGCRTIIWKQRLV